MIPLWPLISAGEKNGVAAVGESEPLLYSYSVVAFLKSCPWKSTHLAKSRGIRETIGRKSSVISLNLAEQILNLYPRPPGGKQSKFDGSGRETDRIVS